MHEICNLNITLNIEFLFNLTNQFGFPKLNDFIHRI